MIPQNKANIVRRFFRRSYVRVRNVTRAVAESAQDLVWVEGIRPKDAIHVATALDGGVFALETFDEGLLAKSGTLGNPPLIIRKPIAPAQRELF
jgi:predicted nucleic acid-binding protein